MTNRRTLFHHRKDKPRSVSKIGLLLCLLLAGGVMVVPASSGIVLAGKAKVRDLALTSGFISFKDCVVTTSGVLTCENGAVGTPLAVALRQIQDVEAQAAEDKKQRQKAENKVRELALENERLAAQLKQAQLAASGSSSFPTGGDIRPTGLAVTNPSTGSMMSTSTQSEQGDLSVEITPPSEEE
jgi:hypothetical protein